MKNNISYLVLFMLFLHLIYCKEKEKNEDQNVYYVDFKKYNKLALDDLPNNFFGETTYITLDNTNEETLFGEIKKIIICSDILYLLDSRQKKIVVYKDGKGLTKIGERGQGPNEYLDIADFDVDKNGNIYLLDGISDKIFVYDSQFKFIKNIVPPFESDIIKCLDNDSFMFGLCSWNNQEYEGKKIVIVDSDMNYINSYLDYDEYIDDNFWISGYNFMQVGESIFYHRPIDNNVFVFNLKGELMETIQFDFGVQNVADKHKQDVEKNLNYFDEYCALRDFTISYNGFIIGYIWDKREHKLFIIDNLNQTIYISPELPSRTKNYFLGVYDGKVISYIDPDDYKYLDGGSYINLPASIKEDLKNDKFVICLKEIKNTQTLN